MTQDHWVYLCRDADDRLLYVGVTSCGLRRFALGHAKTATWWSDVARIEIEHLPSRQEALARERALIIDRKPLHNVVHLDAIAYQIPDRPLPTRWLSLTELSELVKADESWVRAKMKDGMPHAYIAGSLRFKADEVISWLHR